jgi:hypothetical protein
MDGSNDDGEAKKREEEEENEAGKRNYRTHTQWFTLDITPCAILLELNSLSR